MFDPKELERAVDCQRRTYALLKWLVSALERGFIARGTVHSYGSDSEAAAEWVGRHFDNLPPNARPPTRDASDVARHANMLATYLAASFEVPETPIQRRVSVCAGCWCCGWIEAFTHLRPKKLTAQDKRRAQKLSVNAVKQLALDSGLGANRDGSAESLAASLEGRERAALLAYGVQLLRRMQGLVDGPAVLALWREFAWDGSAPRKEFELTASSILAAETWLLGRLSA